MLKLQVITQDTSTITQYAKEGAYVSGLILEGARWDLDNGHLTEPAPMELYCDMPVSMVRLLQWHVGTPPHPHARRRCPSAILYIYSHWDQKEGANFSFWFR